MGSVSNSPFSVKSPRPLLAEPARLPRQAEDDPYAWLYDLQVEFGATLPCQAKSVVLALWARACTHQYKIAVGALEHETGLAPAEVRDGLRELADRHLIVVNWLQSGVWHFYLLPVAQPAGRAGR